MMPGGAFSTACLKVSGLKLRGRDEHVLRNAIRHEISQEPHRIRERHLRLLEPVTRRAGSSSSRVSGTTLRSLLAPAYAASMSMGKVSRWNFGASGQPFRHS
jgi:hypothetical protein